MIMRIHRSAARAPGFSLIEVLIAVVVLATGLLALTALQGRLAQASAEAKTRSRIAAMLASRMDELRAGQYANTALDVASGGTTTTTFTCVSGVPAWVCNAQTESAITGLSVGQTVERYTSAIGASSFAVSGTAAANLAIPEFKRITLTATWTDASGSGKRLSMSSDVSPLSLTSATIPNAPNGGGSGGNAIVRQDNPAGPGVIPIAIGGGDATAASNPRPEIIGKNQNQEAVGTRFDVLTYEGLSGASVIQRRVETAVVDCTCEYGAGGTNLGEIYRTAQWPAEWTGEKYEVIAPTGATVAPGDALTAKSGPASGVTQSPLCTECCRDHHDASANGTKFDPVRTGNYDHYNASLTAVAATSGTRYIEACRLVRVDGFWRTATDMYAKHFGLINTSAVAGVPAKSGAPDATAVTTYQAYVKSYLAGYVGDASTIADAADGGQVTGTINIASPPPADERYLHARGLYVDYLNAKARARITKARLTANCPGGDLTECTLPYLPFTTINNTELSYWEPRVSGTVNNDTLIVATGSSLVYDPLQPTRGRTNAKSTASNGSTSDATAIITRSNAGVAISNPVDPGDQTATANDKQTFRVAASSVGTGESFSVRLAGPSSGNSAMAFYDNNTSNDPAIAWTNVSGAANCNGSFSNNGDKDPNDYSCATYAVLGIATSVSISNYFKEYVVRQSVTHTCGTQSVTESIDVPTFANYQVSSAVVGTTAATSLTVANNGKTAESTVAAFGSVGNGSLVDVTFTLEGTTAATIASCVAVAKGNSYEFSNIVWNKPWLTP